MLVFFDTTSIYFEGEGGETIGHYGHSKDHHPDRKQMVVGAVLDLEGPPLCCEFWLCLGREGAPTASDSGRSINSARPTLLMKARRGAS